MSESTKTEQEDRGRTDALTDLIRTGAQQLLAQALKVEVADLLASYADQRDERGMRGSCLVAIIRSETFRQELGR